MIMAAHHQTQQIPEEHTDTQDEFEIVERDHKVAKRPKMKQGAFQIYTGQGKGKSTASLGLMLRALGACIT